MRPLGRWIVGRIGGWCLLILAALCAFAVLTGAVEGAALGGGAALRLGLAGIPAALGLLMPAAAGLGTAAALAQMDGRTESLALHACGLSPSRTAPYAALVGLLLGLGQLATRDHLLWRGEALRHSVVGAATLSWVWLDEGLYRPADGLLVEMRAGRILAVRRGEPLPAAEVQAARMRQQPRTASAASLRAGSGEGPRLERSSRRAGVLGCILVAVGAWLGPGRGLGRVAAALAGVLLWLGADALLLALAAQGQLPHPVGAWGASALALAAVGAGLWIRR